MYITLFINFHSTYLRWSTGANNDTPNQNPGTISYFFGSWGHFTQNLSLVKFIVRGPHGVTKVGQPIFFRSCLRKKMWTEREWYRLIFWYKIQDFEQYFEIWDVPNIQLLLSFTAPSKWRFSDSREELVKSLQTMFW